MVTFVCFRLNVSITTAALLYLIVVVLASLTGSFILSAVVSIIAILCVDYFFTEPLFNLDVTLREPLNLVALITFLGTALVITSLMSKVLKSFEVLREQARLLDLTHDGIFVRDMNNVIKYWNRGAGDLYGWTAEQTVGKVTSHELLKTVFPKALAQIEAELLSAGRWVGELVHTKQDGTQVVVASRWSLQRDKRGAPVAVLETNNDVTERKLAEEGLRESEKKYRYIFQTAGVSIWEEDWSCVKTAIDELIAQGVHDVRSYCATHPEFVQQAIRLVRIVDVNDTTVTLFGADSKEELLVFLHKIFLSETHEVFAEELIALAEGRTSIGGEAVLQTLKGQKLTVLFTVTVVFTTTFPPRPSRYDRVLVTLMDITERKRVEHRLSVQHHITGILAEAPTLQDAMPRILEAIAESLMWDVAAAWTVDKQADVLRCVDVWHKSSLDVPEFEAQTRAATFMRGMGLPGRVWFSGEPIHIPDVVHDASFLRAPLAAREVLHAAFGFPIVLGREVMGVMEFFSHEIREPDQGVLDMMATIGGQIGQFTERKRAEEALHKAKAELAHVTRVTTLGEMTASIASRSPRL